MCILQDFEALTPNTLARTVETVSGGGLVVFLLKSMDSLRQLCTMAMVRATVFFNTFRMSTLDTEQKRTLMLCAVLMSASCFRLLRIPDALS